jgi:hypothetical protein
MLHVYIYIYAHVIFHSRFPLLIYFNYSSSTRAQTFKMANYYIIKEIPVSNKLIFENSTKLMFNKLPTKWDSEDYTGAFQPEREWVSRGLVSSVKAKRIGEDLCMINT